MCDRDFSGGVVYRTGKDFDENLGAFHPVYKCVCLDRGLFHWLIGYCDYAVIGTSLAEFVG